MAVKFNKKLFRDLSFAEGEGIGTWYEYLAKATVLGRICAQSKISSVLLLGLPEKYGLALDILSLPELERLVVVDPRKKRLEAFRELASGLLAHKKISFFNEQLMKFVPPPGRRFDLVTNTEVLQGYRGKALLQILPRIFNLTERFAALFVPNAECYAHPKMSGLKSHFKSELEKVILDHTRFSLLESGYIDAPPWPAGLSVQSGKGRLSVYRDLLLALENKISLFLIPLLVRIEKCYPQFIKKRQAHMIYFVLQR